MSDRQRMERAIATTVSFVVEDAGFTADDVMRATRHALDELLGGLVAVFHTTGGLVEGVGQLCSRCGYVLDDAPEGFWVGDREYGPKGWPPGVTVSVLQRWGEDTNPRTMAAEHSTREPNGTDERWCSPAP